MGTCKFNRYKQTDDCSSYTAEIAGSAASELVNSTGALREMNKRIRKKTEKRGYEKISEHILKFRHDYVVRVCRKKHPSESEKAYLRFTREED